MLLLIVIAIYSIVNWEYSDRELTIVLIVLFWRNINVLINMKKEHLLSQKLISMQTIIQNYELIMIISIKSLFLPNILQYCNTTKFYPRLQNLKHFLMNTTSMI